MEADADKAPLATPSRTYRAPTTLATFTAMEAETEEMTLEMKVRQLQDTVAELADNK